MLYTSKRMALAVTLSGTAQALGYLVLVVVGIVALGYAWYRQVSYPRFRREARKSGFVAQGENVFGDTQLAPWDESAHRPLSLREWLKRRD